MLCIQMIIEVEKGLGNQCFVPFAQHLPLNFMQQISNIYEAARMPVKVRAPALRAHYVVGEADVNSYFILC